MSKKIPIGVKNFNLTDMIFKEDIDNIKSSRKDLRNFGLLFGVIFCGLGIYFWSNRPYLSVESIVVSTLMLSFGLFIPNLLKPFQRIWMILAVVLSWIMTKVILITFYYVILTPVALFARLCGKKFLDLTFRSPVSSYWKKRSGKVYSKTDYEKQY